MPRDGAGTALTSANSLNRLFRACKRYLAGWTPARETEMVHYDQQHGRGEHALSRLVRHIFGIACLISVPGIWAATQGALPEARIMGLALSLVVLGIAGLCFAGTSRH